MFILDDFQEAIGEANLINGFDLNTEDSAELEVSKQTLLEQKDNARGFSTNSVQNLVSGAAVSTRRGTATSSTSATRSTTRRSTATRPAPRASRSGPT